MNLEFLASVELRKQPPRGGNVPRVANARKHRPRPGCRLELRHQGTVIQLEGVAKTRSETVHDSRKVKPNDSRPAQQSAVGVTLQTAPDLADHEQNVFWTVLDLRKVPAVFVALGNVLRGSQSDQELQIHGIQELDLIIAFSSRKPLI